MSRRDRIPLKLKQALAKAARPVMEIAPQGSNGGATSNASTLDGLDSTDFALASHTHPQSSITNLASDLAGKASVSHTHPWSAVTITIPPRAFEAYATVTDAACTSGSMVEVSLASTTSSDENEPEMVTLGSLAASPSNGSFQIVATFLEPHAGPLKINYRIN